MKAEDLIMKADASPEEVVADGEGLGKNVNVMTPIDERAAENGVIMYQKASSQKEFVPPRRRTARHRPGNNNHSRLASSLRTSLRRTNGQQPRKLAVDNLPRTDGQGSIRLDLSENELAFIESNDEENNLDGSDSSRSNNSTSPAHYIRHMKSVMRMPFSRRHIPESTPEDEVPVIPDSEVERIVQRLETRNANRVAVPAEVKAAFLRMCLNVCRLRNTDSDVDCGCGEIKVTSDSPCIMRDDVINMRNRARLEVELRSRSRRIIDAIKTFCGFRCHSEVLLHVLNRAVDLIDSSGHKKARERRRSSYNSTEASNSEIDGRVCTRKSLDDEEWFYYKDFAFYSLKVESEYPWIRSPVLYSILVTFSFYLMSPILWCEILRDGNICPTSDDGLHNDWLSPLYFASVTMSTVGYGDLTVLGSDEYVESWRLFIAIIFMIFSLLVSVVGLQAGLDTQFNPFRRRIDIFLNRVYEIINEKKDMDKHDHIVMRMKWSKIAELAEVILIFLLLNLLGVFALRISLALDSETVTMSWMESFYWAVQTTTTVGYGDVETPHSFRWFLLFYLAISTYFVGNAIGKLRDLSERLDSMQRLHLWQQQEASYEMLNDFSGRVDHTTTEDGRVVDIEPEIDQFEFCIASLVLMGKITSEDVRIINDKFKQLTKTNKITSADVPGPTKKKDPDVKSDDENQQSSEEITHNGTPPRKSSTLSAVSVGKKIVIAFKEEVLVGGTSKDDAPDLLDAENKTPDYKDFSIPTNTYAIGIDDSQIQRKLIEKFFMTAGIPRDHCTIIGNGRDEIMGFEDFTVQYMENHGDSFVFLIVDENLDVMRDDGTPLTISGSECVENIRKRLPQHLERRMLALIRSANDSSSDVALYKARAHGFLPKAPVKKGGVLEALAPQWLQRFPPDEFGYSSEIRSQVKMTNFDDVSCSPLDIDQKLNEIEQLFDTEWSESKVHLIKDSMHELKGDLLTFNSNVNVASMVGLINLIITAHSYATMLEKWIVLRDKVKETLSTLEKNFKLPLNTFGIAIDDSQIQRKLLARFFSNAGIPTERQIIHGKENEILGFEDFVVQYVNNHLNDFIFIIVDENLEIESKDGSKQKSISGSHCVEKIRKRLPKDAERRILALVRSANDSTSDVSLYNIRCHGFLPKAPLRKEKINETLAPLWYKRFPPSEFGLCLGTDEEISIPSEDVACSSTDILQKLNEIDSLFDIDAHVADPSRINDVMHELKGDLLTMTGFNVSMIGILGQINLMIQTSHEPDETALKWQTLKDRTREAIQALNIPQDLNPKARRSSVVQMIKSRPTILSSSLSRDF